eukprot:403358381
MINGQSYSKNNSETKQKNLQENVIENTVQIDTNIENSKTLPTNNGDVNKQEVDEQPFINSIKSEQIDAEIDTIQIQTETLDDQYMQKFYLGYVPKDIAYNLSQLLDSKNVFYQQNLVYIPPKQTKQSFIEVELNLKQNVLKDQRMKSGQTFLLKSFPGMPASLKQALFAVNKFNLNKEFIHSIDPEDPDDEINEKNSSSFDIFGDSRGKESPSQNNRSATSSKNKDNNFGQTEEINKEKNKYNRNFILVIETVQNYGNLFSEKEKEMLDTYVNKLSPEAQTILARLMLRKRVWFNQAEHLAKYINDDIIIQQSLDELIQKDFIIPDTHLGDDIVHQLKSQQKSLPPRLEDISEFLESLNMQKLLDINKLVNKLIKNVKIENYVDVYEVSQNPFMKLNYYLKAFQQQDDENINLKLQQLINLNEKIAIRFSGMICEYILENLNQSMNMSLQNGNQAQHNLLRFFSFKQQNQENEDMSDEDSQTSKTSEVQIKKAVNFKQVQKIEEKLHEFFKGVRFIINGNGDQMLFKIDNKILNLLNRCMNLFFFYQTSDPFEQLNMHDYGFYQYEEFQNYLTYQNQIKTKSRKEYAQYLKPIFKKRNQFIKYDAFTQLQVAFEQVKEMKIKKPSILGTLCRKLSKYLIKEYAKQDEEVNLNKDEMKCQILDNIKVIVENTKKPDNNIQIKEPLFILRYKTSSKIAGVLNQCIDFLERDRQYDVACKWWVRLCIDLKHLRMRKECLKVAEHALLESSWVKTGSKNALFRIKEQLAKSFNRQTSKQTTKNRRTKKSEDVSIFQDEEEKDSAEDKKQKQNMLAIEQLFQDVIASQKNNILMTQLNSQIHKQINPDLTDQYQILKEEANPEYFKEVYIRCKKGLTYQYQQEQILGSSDMQRPTYHNPFKNEFYDVENLALRFYSLHQNLNGMHSENGLGTSYFGILMWNEIFYDKIPYVFQTPYQAAPLDFGTKDFYQQRQEIIDDRLMKISEMNKLQLTEDISKLYEANKNKFNQFINWDSLRLNKRRLIEIAQVIGGLRLSRILSNYCKDYKHWNHGMPDLILWDAKTGRVKFSEVKSETDRLSEVQRAWIAFFSQNEIDVEVCYVNRLPHQRETRDREHEEENKENDEEDEVEIYDVFTEELN